MTTRIIGVIGGEVAGEDSLARAREVGRLIAERGAVLVCGGLGGVMEAACRGASEAGGTTVGILPSDSTSDANPYVTIPIATGMGTARNLVIVRTADALIAVDGRYGTLSEIAHALDQGKRVISLLAWPALRGAVPEDRFTPAETPEEAVTLALESAP
jgi:uncharacterized protein (TIGR00725 family)